MSQVRKINKFTTGGKVQKYGTFTRDGINYKVNDQFIARVAAHSPEVAEALRNGDNLVVESSANNGDGAIYGMSKINNISDRKNKKLEHRQGLFEGRRLRDIRNGITSLINADLYTPEAPVETAIKTPKVLDLSSWLDLDYIKNDDNSLKLSNSFTNNSIKERINQYLGGLNSGYDEYKVYSTLKDADTARAYINTVKDILSNDDFKDRLANGTLSKDDLEILKSLGIGMKDSSPAIYTTQTSPDTDPNGGIGNTLKDRISFTNGDSGGNYQLTDKVLENLLKDYTGNIWLNNNFKDWARNAGYDASWIPENTGLFRINGNYYLGSDISKITGNDGVTFSNWKKHNIDTVGGDNSIITQFWGTQNPYKNASLVDGYSSLISPDTYYYDRSGEYLRHPGDPLVYDIVTPDMRKDINNYDEYGRFLSDKAKRLYINPYTKELITNLPEELKIQQDKEAIANYYSPENQTRLTAFSPFIETANPNIRLTNVSSWGEGNEGYGLYFDPNTNNYYWYNHNFMGNNADLSGNVGSVANTAIQIDPRVADWVKNNLSKLYDPQVAYYLDTLVRNPFLRAGSLRTDADANDKAAINYGLSNLINELNQTGYNLRDLEGNTTTYNYDSGGNTPLYNSARALGAVLDFKNPVELHKNGGTLKYQEGGVAYNTSNNATKQKLNRTKTPVRKAGRDRVIGSGQAWTDADTAESAALLADASSLFLSFVPGVGNVGAGIAGLGGSLANLWADTKRDGFDLRDLGTFGLNVALDLGTLIPGAGSAAKAAKIVKAFKNSSAISKMVKLATVGASLGSGAQALVTSWDKIQNGGWTINDIRNIVNGLRGASNLGKVRSPKITKPAESMTLKGKSPITLTKQEVDTINSAEDRAKALTDLIKSKKGFKDYKIDSKTLNNITPGADIGKTISAEIKAKSGVDVAPNEVTSILNAGSVDENVNTLNNLIASRSKINLDDYEIPTGFNFQKGKWYKPWTMVGKSKIKDLEIGTEQVPLNPKEASFFDYITGKRRAAIRDAKTNPENPYFKEWAIPSSGSYIPAKITPVIWGDIVPSIEHPAERSEVINAKYFYKEGGKIIKAQNGINKVQPLGIKAPKASEITYKGFGSIKPLDFTKPEEVRTFYGAHKRDINPIIFPEVASIAGGLISNKRSADLSKKGATKAAYGKLKTNDPEFYHSFTDNGIQRQTQQQMDAIRFSKPVSNDDKAFYANKFARDMAAESVREKGNTALSAAYDKYNASTLEAKRAYAAKRTAVENYNKEILGQLDNIKAQTDANLIQANWNSILNPTLNQIRKNITLDQNEKIASKTALDQLDYHQQARQYVDRALHDLKTRYNNKLSSLGTDQNAIASFKSKFGNSSDDYIAKVLPQYQQDLAEQLQGLSAVAMYNNSVPRVLPKQRFTSGVLSRPMLNDLGISSWAAPAVVRSKKGGTLTLNDRLILQDAKDSRKAIQKMNDNVVKLIIEMLHNGLH